jgi:hypothetical protein
MPCERLRFRQRLVMLSLGCLIKAVLSRLCCFASHGWPHGLFKGRAFRLNKSMPDNVRRQSALRQACTQELLYLVAALDCRGMPAAH